MSSETRPEVGRLDNGELVLEDEGWWEKIRI